MLILVETKGLMGLAGMMLLANVALAAFGSIYVLYVNYRFGWGPAQAGLVLTVFAAGNIAAQALLAGPRSSGWASAAPSSSPSPPAPWG
jgi:DHA1 family tetracycline resistance protein-like MFS transporter